MRVSLFWSSEGEAGRAAPSQVSGAGAGGMSSHLRVWSLWQCRCCLCSLSSGDSGFVFWDAPAEAGGSVLLGFPPSLRPVLIPLPFGLFGWV